MCNGEDGPRNVADDLDSAEICGSNILGKPNPDSLPVDSLKSIIDGLASVDGLKSDIDGLAASEIRDYTEVVNPTLNYAEIFSEKKVSILFCLIMLLRRP